MDIASEAPEFLYNNPETRSFENQWWRTCVAIRWHCVAPYPAVDAKWAKLAPLAVAPRPISPRFMQYVENLGMFNLDQVSFWKALRTLRAQQEFQGLIAAIGEPLPISFNRSKEHPALAVLQVLLTDGLISPAGTVWLVIAVYRNKELYSNYVPLLFGFSAVRRKVWNNQNMHLAACTGAVKEGSGVDGKSASRISAADAKDTYRSVLPGTLKHAFEKQQARAALRKADKSSTGSKKKSRRLQKLPPLPDSPAQSEAPSRQPTPENRADNQVGDDAPIDNKDETASKVLAHVLVCD